MVVADLAEHFPRYKNLHRGRSRHSGGSVCIEIFLEFEGEMRMCEVQDVIDRMKASLERKIPGSSVNIIPSNGRP
ncbi:MAG: cation transporter dimerization domain-containing protein [Methanoregulaceae archaeon]